MNRRHRRPRIRARRLVLSLIVVMAAGYAIDPLDLWAGASAEKKPWTEFTGKWTYTWQTAPHDPTDWNPIDSPTNPPGRGNRTAVHFRTDLPASLPTNAALFVPSVDTAFSVSIGGKQVYSYGITGGNFDHKFHGWPWHLISLPPDSSGKQMDFLVHSEYHDIGLWGKILLGTKDGLYLYLAARDAPRLLVAAALLTIALLGALVFLFGSPRRTYVLMAGITLLMVIRVIADTYLKQSILSAALFWEYIEAATSFAIPGTVALFLVDIVSPKFVGLMRTVGIVYIVAGGAGIGLSLLGAFPVYVLFTPSEIFFGVFILLYIFATFVSLSKGSRESVILLATFLVMAALNIHDILVARSLLPWTDTTEHYMIFFFAAGLATVVAMRIATMHAEMGAHAVQLAELNASLEQTVSHRTRELEQTNLLLEQEKARLEVASNTDELTRLYNRRYLQGTLGRELRAAQRYGHPLSVIMLDLDFFKLLNDTYGHVEGDAVLKTVAAIITNELRDIDYAARYGGEEFLVVLPRTDMIGACKVAERIRNAVETHHWPEGRHTTISGGVAAQLPDRSPVSIEELVRAADNALYRAKEGGRNRVNW
ncbi:MAG TPA: diguanylate cyclase [Spirochaetia bacterium]|nr:diguanylate cyclase [Spirochaetia bacterium]